MFDFLWRLRHRYNLSTAQWNFFAPMHGKGAVDGVGACAKRAVWSAIKSQSVTVNNAEEFCKTLAGKEQLEAVHIDDFSQLPWVNETCKTTLENAMEVRNKCRRYEF
jgi:hypothetical protein